MFEEDKLRNMVVDLKLGEISESLDEMLSNISKDNIYYNEISKTKNRVDELKKEYKDYDEEMLFLEFRGWFCINMEKEILSYIKGVF